MSTSHQKWRAKAAAPAIVAAVLLAPMPPAAGADSPTPFRMLAATDAPGGRAILRGDYATAIQQAAASADHREWWALWRAANLCVAYTMSALHEQAVAACDHAVALGTDARRPRGSIARQQSLLAAMHANRAVAHWAASDFPAAESDLAVALRHAPNAAQVRANAAAFAVRR